MAMSVSTSRPIPSPRFLHFNCNRDNYGSLRNPKIPHKFFKPLCSSIPKQIAPTQDKGMRVTESGVYSVSDSQLKARGLELHRTAGNLDLDELNALFEKVGFPRRDEDLLRRALRNTPSLLWLRHRKSGQVVAFANATGDDVFNAIIWDVAVDPSFQGSGLGTAVVERMVADLLAKGITNIALFAEPHVLGFYRQLGFVADPGGIRAMVYKYLF